MHGEIETAGQTRDRFELERSLLDLAYDAVLERGFDDDIIQLWNRSATQLYGWSAQDAVGRSVHQLLRTVFPEPFEQIQERLLREGHWEGELIHTARSGRRIVVTSRWAVREEAGRPIGILEVNNDITSQKRAAEERAQLAAIVLSSYDAIIGKTLDAIVTSWNPAAERLYGYQASEIIGRPISILIPQDMPDELPNIMARVRRGLAVEHYETQRIRKDGVRLFVSISVSPVRDAEGKVVGAATIARDITERRRAEEERNRLLARAQAAREEAEWAERHLAFLAEASAVLGGSLDYETTLTNVARLAVPHVADWCSVNIVDEEGEVRRLVVHHADPTKIALAEELETRYPPDPTAPAGAARVIQTGRSIMIPEITPDMIEAGARDTEHARLIRELRLQSIMVVPLIARDRVFGVITFAMAESGRSYDVDDLALAEDLARRAGMAMDNAQLYRDAQEALRLREEFLSIASHELKTPLTALQLQAQLLRRLTVGSSERTMGPDMANRVIEAVERQVKRLTRLTNDLLDVSRISSGRFELERTEVDLSALVHEIVERFVVELAAAGCVINVHAEPGIVGRWDRLRVDQVITNLLSNAVKYGRGKPIEITVQAHDGDRACLTIRDHGIGIQPDTIQKIFDRFERLETPERTGGLGLGLYIVRHILEAHGGTVRVESQPGDGAAFIVEIPR